MFIYTSYVLAIDLVKINSDVYMYIISWDRFESFGKEKKGTGEKRLWTTHMLRRMIQVIYVENVNSHGLTIKSVFLSYDSNHILNIFFLDGWWVQVSKESDGCINIGLFHVSRSMIFLKNQLLIYHNEDI